MRRVRFEQIRRSSLPNFIRDTKKYLLNKRQEIQSKNVQEETDIFALDNIKIIDSEDKIELKISDQSLKPKQKDFIKFVVDNIK